MAKEMITGNSNPLSVENLQRSLKEAIRIFWAIPQNRKLNGRTDSDILPDIVFQDLGFMVMRYGNLVNQFELLKDALEEKENLPLLQGNIQIKKTIAGDTATYSFNCIFKLDGADYEVNSDGNILIKKIFISKRS